MTIFDNIPFKKLQELLEELYKMHCNILIAGNTQPDWDEEYWKEAEKNYIKIKGIINEQYTYEKNTHNTR